MTTARIFRKHEYEEIAPIIRTYHETTVAVVNDEFLMALIEQVPNSIITGLSVTRIR